MVSKKLKKKLIKLSSFWIPFKTGRVWLRETLKALWLDKTIRFSELFGQKTKVSKDSSAKTILVIDAQIPTFDRDTGSRATWAYLKFFKKIGLNVVYLPMKSFPRGHYLTNLLQSGIDVVLQSPKKYLKTSKDEPDFVYLNRPNIAEKLLPELKKKFKAKIIYQAHDLHFLREKRCFEETDDKQALVRSNKYKELEQKIAETVDVFCSFSDVEIETMRTIAPKASYCSVPLYLWEKEKEVLYQADSRKDLMFVGGFSHQPNRDAVAWFATEVFPQVLKVLPDLKFYVVGANPPDSVLKYASKNIIFKGFMTDEALDKMMQTIRLNVVPLRFGAGIKGKIIESVYNGLPVLTTSVGAEGIPTSEAVTVRDSAKDFAAELIALYQDETRLTKASESAGAFIRRHYSQAAAFEKIKPLLGELKK